MTISYITMMNELPNDLYHISAKESNEKVAGTCISHKSFNFKIRSSTDQITGIVQKFDHLLENNNCCSSRTKSELSTALSEALANAIIHGNKIDPNIFVDLKVQIYNDKMILRVKDKGAGFDLSTLPNPLTSENLKKTSGRGVYLMSVLVDEVDFIRHNDGMEVVLVKYLKKDNRNESVIPQFQVD